MTSSKRFCKISFTIFPGLIPKVFTKISPLIFKSLMVRLGSSLKEINLSIFGKCKILAKSINN